MLVGSAHPRILLSRAAHLLDMDPAPTPPGGLPQLIDLETLATYLGVPVATVYDWRTRRLGPPAYRFGKRLMFAVPDVQAWIEQQRDPRRR